MTILRGATASNDGTTAESRRSWRCHGGLCRTSTAVASRLRCDGGITLVAIVFVRHNSDLTQRPPFILTAHAIHAGLTKKFLPLNIADSYADTTYVKTGAVIKDNNGRLIIESKEVMRIWAAYVKELLNGK